MTQRLKYKKREVSWTTKAELEDLYWSQGLTLMRIADRYQKSYDVIRLLFIKWKIPRAQKGTRNKKYHTEEERQKAVSTSYKKYREANRDVYNKASLKWQEENKEQHLGYQRKTSRRRYTKTIAFVNRVKTFLGCHICGYKKCPRAIDFHHRDPATKMFSVGQRLSYSITTLKEEMRKCDIICNRCHQELEWQKRQSLGPSKISRKKGAQFVDKVKLIFGCQMCGYKKCPSAIHFHHRDPTEKEFAISTRKGAAIARLKSEMRKCDIVCCRCHLEMEWSRK